VFNFAGDLAISLHSNYSEFPNGSLRLDTAIFKDTLEMLVDRWDRDLK